MRESHFTHSPFSESHPESHPESQSRHSDKGDKGGDVRITRRGFLSTAFGAGAALGVGVEVGPERADAQGRTAEIGADILVSREQVKTEIVRIQAEEFAVAVRGFCDFIRDNMIDSQDFVFSLLRNRRKISSSDSNQLNLRIYGIEAALTALQDKVKENGPVLRRDSYKPGNVEKLGVAAALGAAIAADITHNYQVGNVAGQARRASDAARYGRLQVEQIDRWAGILALDETVYTLSSSQEIINNLLKSLNSACLPELSSQISRLSAAFKQSSLFVSRRLEALKKNRTSKRRF